MLALRVSTLCDVVRNAAITAITRAVANIAKAVRWVFIADSPASTDDHADRLTKLPAQVPAPWGRFHDRRSISDLHLQDCTCKVRLPGGQGRCRESIACIPRRLTEPSLSALRDRARRLRRMQGCETRFQPSSKTFASLQEASPRHRQGLPSSTRLAQAEKLFPSFA